MARSSNRFERQRGCSSNMCIHQGTPCVGVDNFEQLTDAVKVSRRDIGYVMANQLNGGTTIALTMILSHLAGIRVFATGGLGGVHRDGQYTMDNLNELEFGKVEKVVPSVLVAGSVALDTVAKLSPGVSLRFKHWLDYKLDWGVGYNVATASKYVCESTKFVSRIGDDPAGKAIAQKVPGLEVASGRTAQYMCTHDANGELIVAAQTCLLLKRSLGSRTRRA
ncbi:Pseudouridine-5'-phosphate glycosidase [Candida viswanathii]|uniref:Pseudouridine-5'-phosphate glycosidase n=1 Tax=Candida viswanathii TaxID=5486 RepID=A0A367YF13_9ASCO|nr:Pseudouridine-5'-phosphate glycosidase [Candida viswanathii]